MINRYAGTGLHRGVSQSIWHNVIDWANRFDSLYGSGDFEDFIKGRANTTSATSNEGWFLQQAAGGGSSPNFSSKVWRHGLATLSATGAGNHEGVEVQAGAIATGPGEVQFAAGRRVPVECYLDFTLNMPPVFFVGVVEPDSAAFLSATSTLPTDRDYMGFYRNAAGDIQFVSRRQAGPTTYTKTLISNANIVTPSSGKNFWKLGFAVDDQLVTRIAINGILVPTKAGGAGDTVPVDAVPTEYLVRKVALTRGTAGAGNVAADIDWFNEFTEENAEFTQAEQTIE